MFNFSLVNYAARDFGVKRHTSVAEALLKCPQLRLVHVPTYSVAGIEGGEEIVAIPRYQDEMPAYRSDGTRLPPNPPDPASNKACLEPYRQASMEIFRVIRDWCRDGEGILLEKGGLDEAFLDVTETVEQELIEEFDQKYTMLRDELENSEVENGDEEEDNLLELFDTTWIDGLDYTGLGGEAIQLTESKNEGNSASKVMKKLGKLRIWKGAQLAASLRSRLRTELNFIASIGIAPNKMLAKLVSALYKPDRQTRIDPESVGEFMRKVPFEKIRMMGGKMGKSVLSKGRDELGGDEEDEDNSDSETEIDQDLDLDREHVKVLQTTTYASDLLPLTLDQLTDRVGDRSTALWIHQLIRGHDPTPVTPRSLTKSFMSAKSFRPAVKEWPELHDWVVVLVGELWSRITEEKENSARWPSNITIHFKAFTGGKASFKPSAATWSNTGAVTKSCEFPFSSVNPSQATRSDFLSAVFKLLTAAAPLFPMSRLAVSVTNFKSLEADGKVKATRVDQFFSKQPHEQVENIPMSLERFFKTKEKERDKEKESTSSTSTAKSTATAKSKHPSVLDMLKANASVNKHVTDTHVSSTSNQITKSARKKSTANDKGILKFFSKTTADPNSFTCTESNCSFKCPRDSAKEIQEHIDHHFALKLASEP